jgi:hypothetical protein
MTTAASTKFTAETRRSATFSMARAQISAPGSARRMATSAEVSIIIGAMPEDAREAIGHGVPARRSRSGAVSFELLEAEDRHNCCGAGQSPSPARQPRKVEAVKTQNIGVMLKKNG